MMKYEFYNFIYNKKKILIFILFISLIVADSVMVFLDSFLFEYVQHPFYDLSIVYKSTPSPATAAFLSGASRGHLMQMAVLFPLPLYLLIMVSDEHISELKHNTYGILVIRSKKDLFITKTLFSFFVGFISMFIGLVLNYIICLIVFRNGLSQNPSANNMPYLLSSALPNIAYFIYIIIVSAISGLIAMAASALSFVVRYRMILYGTIIAIWYLLIINKYSITYIMQPFIEYGMDYIGIALGLFIMSVCISYSVSYIFVKKQPVI